MKFFRSKSQRLLFAAALSLVGFLHVDAHARIGGSDGGGGSSIGTAKKDPRVLLDLYLDDRFDRADVHPGTALESTRALKSLGIERMRKAKHPALEVARNTLNRWAPRSRGLIKLLQQELESAPFFYVSYRFGFADTKPFIPSGFVMESRMLNLVAFYSDELGVLFSKPEFDVLCAQSQVAVIIHEALRHLQNRMGFHFSTKSLQGITATIVLVEPSSATQWIEDMVELDGSLKERLSSRRDFDFSVFNHAPLDQETLLSFGSFGQVQALKEAAINSSGADDFLQLADASGRLAEEVRKWRFANSSQLPNGRWDQIASYEWKLLNLSEDLVTQSVGLGGALGQIEPAAQQLKDTVRDHLIAPIENLIDQANGVAHSKEISLDRDGLRQAFRKLEREGLFVRP